MGVNLRLGWLLLTAARPTGSHDPFTLLLPWGYYGGTRVKQASQGA
jgi:hypothetical protein